MEIVNRWILGVEDKTVRIWGKTDKMNSINLINVNKRLRSYTEFKNI